MIKIMKTIMNSIKMMINNIINGGMTMMTPSGMVPFNIA